MHVFLSLLPAAPGLLPPLRADPAERDRRLPRPRTRPERRRLASAHLGRDLEDQSARVGLAANLKHPDYVRAACGTLDQLPQAFAQLDCQKPIGPPRLKRTNRNAELRRRNRAWPTTPGRGCP